MLGEAGASRPSAKEKEKVRVKEARERESSRSYRSTMTSNNSLLAPHQRLRASAQAWVHLKDVYAVKVITEGLRLPWCAGFDPSNPSDDFRPRWGRNPPDLPDVVSMLVDELINSGSVREVPREFLQACSSIFAIPKVGSDKCGFG